MGVSVSVSTAIIVAGLFVAFTAFYPIAANGFDRVTDAQHDVGERALERQNTAVSIDAAERRDITGDDTDELVVNVTNTGGTGLVVADTTLVVDNEYVDLTNVNTTVYDRGEPTGETGLWLTDETLEIGITDDDIDGDINLVDRIVVITEIGVRDASVVTDGDGGGE